MASAVRTRWIPLLVLLVVAGGIWWFRRNKPPQYSIAYVGDRSAILWSTTAQVRERVAELHYGQRVAVMGHSGQDAEIRSDNGVHGWIDAQLLMSPDLWQHTTELLTQARAMPVQASGHTRAPSNVHMEPGRAAPRIFQFGRNVSVVVLDRRVSPVSAPAEGASEGDAPGHDTDKPKPEDWLLVLHEAPQGGVSDAALRSPSKSEAGADIPADIPMAGWVLARFIELDPPAPIPDYASSAGFRVVAWMVLDKVPDDGGERPQYLVAAAHGGEGQPCDFTALRVYTWGTARQRYETAYVENDLCGQLPIRVGGAPDGAEFQFAELDEDGAKRVYRMKQTVVRRVREDQRSASRKR